MEKKVIPKNLIRDCLPTVFSLMLSGLYSVMDGLFVGRAAGDTGLAAVNLAWPLVAVITATGIGIGSGGSVLFSNLAGKDEKEESEKELEKSFINNNSSPGGSRSCRLWKRKCNRKYGHADIFLDRYAYTPSII